MLQDVQAIVLVFNNENKRINTMFSMIIISEINCIICQKKKMFASKITLFVAGAALDVEGCKMDYSDEGNWYILLMLKQPMWATGQHSGVGGSDLKRSRGDVTTPKHPWSYVTADAPVKI